MCDRPLSLIHISGDIIENLVYAATNNDKLLFKDGYTVRSMSNKPYAEYVVYVEGTEMCIRDRYYICTR